MNNNTRLATHQSSSHFYPQEFLDQRNTRSSCTNWPGQFWTWSLKSGGRYVGFEKRVHLEAFAYLSAQRDCVKISELPSDPERPLPESVSRLINMGTRDINGRECLYVVQDSNDPRGKSLAHRWGSVENAVNGQGKTCRLIQSVDLARHQILIRNWLKMMNGVRTAELDPDVELQIEIAERASHPEGISIRTAIDHIDPSERDYALAQIYWLIHEQELVSDIESSLLSDGSILYRSRFH